MNEIWEGQTVENAKWCGMYNAIIQGAYTMAALEAAARPSPKDGEDVPSLALDFEALATETDEAYARYAARITGKR